MDMKGEKTGIKLDILAFGAHPDDVELSASGTVAKHIALGYKVGIVDLTQGELGTRGTAETRYAEAKEASQILGISARENLKFKDGFFVNDKAHQLEIIKMLRKYRPEIVLCNAVHDRHPDHGKGSNVVSDACFYSGLIKIETELNGEQQKAWRPKVVYHYLQFYNAEPDLVVDISDYIETKLSAIKAYKTQFYDPNSKEPETVIAKKEYLDSIKGRDIDFGKIIGTSYAEGFTKERYIGVKNLFDLI
jgi:bacillithiol biosynthesis deacetylase BshB1